MLALAQAFVPDITWLIVIRFLLGIPLGSDISTGYTYIMESIAKGQCEVMGNRWQFMFAVASDGLPRRSAQGSDPLARHAVRLDRPASRKPPSSPPPIRRSRGWPRSLTIKAIHVPANCAPNAYDLLNNYVPAYIGSGTTDPINNGPFTLPPVIKQRHVGDALSQAQMSWAYFGERWNDFKTAPGLGLNPGLDPVAYLYCNICNPFLYSASVMTNQTARDAHIKDTLDLYDGIANGNLPAVSWVSRAPSMTVTRPPRSSRFSSPSRGGSSSKCSRMRSYGSRPPS